MKAMIKYIWLLVPVLLLLFIDGNVQKPFEMTTPQFVSACPYPNDILQPDGKPLTIRLVGDEFLHYTRTLDGYTLLKDENGFYRYTKYSDDGDMIISDVIANNPETRGLKESAFLQKIRPGIHYSEKQFIERRYNRISRGTDIEKFAGISGTFPSTGTRKLLVILVSFTDKTFVKTNANFNGLYNSNTINFKNYYLATSYNKLTVNTTVVGPYTISGTMATYGANDAYGDDSNPRLMVQEAIDKAEAAGVNFAQFDNNGNGYVDGIQVVHAGYGEEFSGASDDTIWSHRWTLSSYARTYDGVTINDYSTVPELYGASGSTMTGVGVLVHEFGHNIGCPDTYDTDYEDSGGDSWHLKQWDVMASGSWNNSGNNPPFHNPYARWNLGWLSLTTITSTSNLTLNPAETNTTVYRFDTPTSNEYFLLENRQQTGSWDSYLPGHGMLVYHIDGNWISSHSSNNINAYPSHQGVDIEEADNTRTSYDYTGDPFPGVGNKTSFSDSTSPNSKSWGGANTNKPISNIKESSGIITFTITTSGGGTPKIKLSVNKLNFGSLIGGSYTGAQTVMISNSGTGTLSWSLSKSSGTDWLSYTPSSGTNSRQISISVNPSSLSAGSYTGYVYVTASGASNSPQTITVNLTVKKSSSSANPFGDFSTPIDLSQVESSVPITGWALDDIGITGVKIYNGSAFIGDAVFIENARPDVATAYPTYPLNNKAGWGYMLLTNFLPGGGNGWYTIYAKITDKEGHTVSLGFKNIYCVNNQSVNPFGAIDTPTQGGTAKGTGFYNFGWVLTPKPNNIPTNGSTITAYVDGVSLGNVTYNQYREDIATLFPGYANSAGAVGFKAIDMTKYADGVHTIHWIALDSAGHSGGIGSRYFTVMNTGSSLSLNEPTYQDPQTPFFQSISQISDIPLDAINPARFNKGYDETSAPLYAETDKHGANHISIREDERITINLGNNKDASDTLYSGYQIIGNRLYSLPVGSTFDCKSGAFYWQPSAGFIGHYKFVFIASDPSGPLFQKRIHIDIKPKY